MTLLNGTKGNDHLASVNLFDPWSGDVIIGRGGDDDLFGGLGPDVILGAGGNDRAYGGAGDDYVDGGKGHDRLEGGDGWDTLFGRWGNDTLWDSDGGELYGGVGNDTLYTVTEASIVNGGYRIHQLSGGRGNDLVGVVHTADDSVTEVQLGAGQDILAVHGSVATPAWQEVHVHDFVAGVDKLALRFDTDTPFDRFDFNQDGVLTGADLPDVDNGAYVYQGSQQECLMFDIGETHITLQGVQILRPEDFV